jgi:hypothetical protein
MTIDDVTNIAGMADILDIDGIDNLDTSDIEKQIMNFGGNQSIKKDPALIFKEHIDSISRDIGINLNDEYNFESNTTHTYGNTNPVNSNMYGGGNSGGYSGNSGGNSSGYNGGGGYNTNTTYGAVQNETAAEYYATDFGNDEFLNSVTNEQKKQQIVNEAMTNFNSTGFDIEKEKEEDRKDILLEQIDMLRDILEDEGVNITRIQKVDKHSSIEDIESVFKWLTMRNDRNRFGTLGEEIILSGCKFLEKAFDGKRDYFGAKPDLTGWSDTARTKLVRSRYHTSTIISNMMNDYNISPSARLLLELVPSALLYANRRKTNRVFNQEDYSSALSDLR